MLHSLKYLFLSLRPNQWIKNLFIFLPLIFGKKLFVYPANLKCVIAFFLFSLAAGVVYLINDVVDIEGDKVHPLKRLRPIASGKIGVQAAWVTAFVLGVVSIVFSFLLNKYFGWIVVVYLVFNYVYSKILKELVIIDVFCLGVFFLLRVLAGTIVVQVELSYWMIFMAVLLALFLGFTKRRQELRLLEGNEAAHRFVLTKYSAYFIDQMTAVITSSIVVTYMLYTVDSRTVGIFGTRNLIFSIPFVYYGVFRYLYLIHKRREDGDPTHVLLSDRMMQINLFLWVGVCIGVIYFGI